MTKENLLQAAGRHLTDAEILYNAQRYDNSIYLVAYSVECIFKLLINFHTNTTKASLYSHNLVRLQEVTASKLLVIFPQLNNQSTLSREQTQLLAYGHPERRYWSANQFTQEEATSCLDATKILYQETIAAHLLDGHFSLSEV